MSNIAEITRLWAEHETAPFPSGHRSIQVDGQSLTLIQSDAAANIIAYMTSGKRIMIRRLEDLQTAQQRLEQILPTLNPEGKKFFERLKQIVTLVIQDHQE